MNQDTDLFVVGIGASAGGLDALERFFDNVPSDSRLAFVVVQHLSPDFKSLMAELLGRRTKLPIHLVEDQMVVEAGHIYLIPPKKEMIISGGRLLLSERDRQQELTLPIDVFFRSLAQDLGPRAVAIVLSGGGSDGSRGIRDVHDAGGLVLVQDAESAQFNSMPRTAREAGVAHHELLPEDMPRVILDHVSGDGIRAASSSRPVEAPTGLDEVYRMLEAEFGIDFNHYKPSTITRRIERRLRLAQADDIEEYVARLRRDHAELDVLYRDLLIGVTHFFRNPEAFELLEQQILPDLVRQSSQHEPLRVWVAGCATGEEAYSLAVVLDEVTSRLGTRGFKIFATDVHRGSLEVAARGLYHESALALVSPERVQRYFFRVGSHYQLTADLRQKVVFAQHNVIKDAPFTRVDLVTCRNLLIYLQPPIQQKVLSRFHFALNRGGLVFLGSSESPGALGAEFEAVHSHWRVFRKHSDVRIPVEARLQPRAPDPRLLASAAKLTPGRYSPSQLLATYDALLDKLVPPSLLVNDRGEVVHAFAGASKFLQPRDGRVGLHILEMVDEDLRLVLAGGLPRALGSTSPLVWKGVRLKANGESRPYKVSVQRLTSRGNPEPAHVLISFEDMQVADATPNHTQEIDLDQVSRDQLAALQSELTYTKEHLQAAIEQLEASNEELQASNEELLASNEELQSTNEELQSVNEELYTVNAEYQRKIAELTELTNDMDNLLSSTDVGTLFLDEQLRIRKFTPQIADSYNLLPQDVGRPIEIFTGTIDHPRLVEDVRRVLATGEPVECEVRDRRQRALFLRILPYRAKGTIAGVVITLIEVTSLKIAEDALFHERYLLNSLLGSVPDAIYFRDARGRFIRANRALGNRLGLSDPAEAVGKSPFELPDQEAALALHRQDEEVLRTGKPQHYQLERSVRPDGQEQWDLVTRLPLTDRETGGIVGIIGMFRNVTEQKRAEDKIHEAMRRRDEFLAMLSHELRNPLSAVVTATSLLRSSASGSERNERLVEVLDRQSQQMARLLDDLLDASRVTQNKIELRKRRLDLRTVVKDAVDATRSLLQTNQLDLSLEIDGAPIYVDGDPARLQQINVNLLHNASKYTPPGGRIRVVAERQDGNAVIKVEDTGAGIPSDMLRAIFDLFVQSRRTLDRAQGGIGVGLTLVRSLVEMHGGEVNAESDGVGKGSTFVVRLPLAPTPPIEDVLEARPRPPLVSGSRVVIVEDNADTRELLCELLQSVGFECRSAPDGPSGLALIDREKPDIAIVDLGLPGMDGFEVARRLRRDPRHAHILLVALTGYGQLADRAQAFHAGFDEHLVKPVRLEQLLPLLRRAEPDHVRSSLVPSQPPAET